GGPARQSRAGPGRLGSDRKRLHVPDAVAAHGGGERTRADRRARPPRVDAQATRCGRNHHGRRVRNQPAVLPGLDGPRMAKATRSRSVPGARHRRHERAAVLARVEAIPQPRTGDERADDAMAGGASRVSTIVSLRNREGHALHCMLDEPPPGEPRAAVAAVLLCPGIKTRVGPHRLYRKLSGAFLSRGIPVMRVDFRGIGDSEGDWPGESLADIYRLTAAGHCVDDTRSALDWLESRLGIRRCIVGGLCGAANTALHVAREDTRVAAPYSLGLSTQLHGGDEKPAMSAGELRSHRMVYLRKLGQPASWLRLLSLKSDYGLLWRSLAQGFMAKMAGAPAAVAEASAAGLNPDVAASVLP